MNILYCGDENIAKGVVLSVMSLLKQVKEPLHIYILTARVQAPGRVFSPLTEEFKQRLDDLLQKSDPTNTVALLDISDLFAQELPEANLSTRFTPCCMLRLFADQVPVLPEKLLYLDNDVLCRGDISDFYHQDMEGFELAGVLDHYGRWFFRNDPLKLDYLNSGVLLLNLKEIRKTGLFQKCRCRCREKKMFMPDQSAINKLAKHKKIVSRRYNEQRKLMPDTLLQHFTTSFRFFPWVRTVSVKPWDIERMHSVLKLHEYDGLFAAYAKEIQEISTSIKEDPPYACAK